MLMAGLDGIENKINPGEPMDKNLYDLPPEELKEVPTVCGSLAPSLRGSRQDRAFLKKGGVFNDDAIDAYLELKMAEVMRFEITPTRSSSTCITASRPQEQYATEPSTTTRTTIRRKSRSEVERAFADAASGQRLPASRRPLTASCTVRWNMLSGRPRPRTRRPADGGTCRSCSTSPMVWSPLPSPRADLLERRSAWRGSWIDDSQPEGDESRDREEDHNFFDVLNSTERTTAIGA